MIRTEVKHDNSRQRFFVDLDGEDANIHYQLPKEKLIDFQHTYVPKEFRGRGIAEQMADSALNYAREKGFKVVATCKFMDDFLRRHEEFEDLIYKKDT